MKNLAILQLSARYQIAQTLMILAATMVLPILVHLLPNINGHLAGAVLLPVFIAPMFAAFVYKPHVAIFAGIFAPLFNYLIIGRPAPEMVVVLGFEVVLFVLVLNFLKGMKGLRYVAAPVAFLIGSLITAFGLSVIGNYAHPFPQWLTGTAIAIPGILLLGMINLLILRFRE